MKKKSQTLRWLPLDNAAKIYPAARRRNWSNVFRLSAQLHEDIDMAVMASALEVTAKRFPSMAVRLRRGVFWYYLQELAESPGLSPEYSYPLVPMDKAETRRRAMRVIVCEDRVAVEFFHSLTDGNGGLIFLKTLVAEYLEQKYGICVPAEQGVLDRRERPRPEELEDSFLKYAAPLQASRWESTAWHLKGTPTKDRALHLTCFRMPVQPLRQMAGSYGVSVTAFLTAVMMDALQRLQREEAPKRRKPIKVLIPVNLRKLFPSQSLRNFVLYTTPQILPQLGNYSLEEICKIVKHHMGLEITPKQMGMKIATNVSSERPLAIRLLPLFVKNAVMKAVFDTVGECKSCLSLSNLGQVKMPDEMAPYVKRLDFILGVQASAPYNCGAISWGDTLYLNFIRNIRQPKLERQFFAVLQELGLPVSVQSN